MIRVGIVGLGFMGRMHHRCYKALPNVTIAAVWDIDPAKLRATMDAVGNISGAEAPLDFTGVELYTDFDGLIGRGGLDAISITLPTFLHEEYTIRALEAGLNVLCEKPMALNVEQCDRMIAAAEHNDRLLQIGHCIRFWPEYAWAKQAVDSGAYGKVLAATFQRLSATPAWTWDNWLMDTERSGGAALDLHIHDTDFVQYLFGMPQQLFTRGVIGPSSDYDHLVTQYLYPDIAVTAEGSWMMAPGFGFEMSFNLVLEGATISFDSSRDPSFRVAPTGGEPFVPEVPSGDGYSLEIRHFVGLLAGESLPTIITPRQSRDSVMLVEAEKRSARTGALVSVA